MTREELRMWAKSSLEFPEFNGVATAVLELFKELDVVRELRDNLVKTIFDGSSGKPEQKSEVRESAPEPPIQPLPNTALHAGRDPFKMTDIAATDLGMALGRVGMKAIFDGSPGTNQ